MIQVDYVDNRACPTIHCDGCGERITDAQMAGVVWPLGDGRDWSRWGGAPASPRFLCKTNHCLVRCNWPWEELSSWLVQLTANVGMAAPGRWPEALRRAERTERL